MRRPRSFFLLFVLGLALVVPSSPLASGREQGPTPHAAATGVISGQVVEAGSGAPFNSGTVRIWSLDRTWYQDATIAQGYYSATVNAGQYLVQTRVSVGTPTGWVDQIHRAHGNADAPSWYGAQDQPVGTPVTVLPIGAAPTVVNFALAMGHTVSGRVTDAGTSSPIANVTVRFRTANGSYPPSPSTNAAGDYTIIGLPAGVYVAETVNTLGYINETWDNITCYLCAGTPIVVPAAGSAAVTGIDFALTPGVRVSGMVTDEVTGDPLDNYSVYVYDQFGRMMADGRTDATGAYTTGPGVVAGSYYVRATGNQAHISEVYPDVPCQPGCDYSRGTLVSAVAAPARGGPRLVTGINFALEPAGRISGTVTPFGSDDLRVEVYSEGGAQFGSLAVNTTTGAYSVGGLAEGRYYVLVHGSGHVSTLYGNVACPVCSARMAGFWPFMLAGELVEVEAGLETSGVDITLTSAGNLGGAVTDDGGQPIPGVVVAVVNADGLDIARWESDAAGLWQTRDDIPDGTYYLRTRNDLGYIDRIYGGGDCLGASCDPTTGTPVTVSGGTGPVVNFQLTAGGLIAGAVREAATNHKLRLGATFSDTSGTQAAGSRANWVGDYLTTTGLPPGSYYGRSAGTAGYGVILYDGRPCPGWACDVTGGDPILVPAPEASVTVPGIDFTVPVCNPAQVWPKTLPQPYVGIPYSVAFTASGGTGAFVFRAGGNAGLPPGLSLATDGMFAGTPTATASRFYVTVYAIDDPGCPSLSGFFPLSVVTPGAPTFGSVKPKLGLVAGGSTVTIQGTWFLPGVRVFFGADEAASVTVVSQTQLTVVTPAHAAGLVDVRIENADGQSVTQPDAFEYVSSLPDLTVTTLTGPASAGPGQTISVTDTTRNIGPGHAPLTVTVFYLSTDATYGAGDALVGRRSAGVLASGESSTGAADVTIPAGTAAGKYFLLARADGLSDAPETSETNNVRARTLRVAVDLTVLVLTGPKGAAPGDIIKVGDTIRNAGPGAAPASVTRYYLSDNNRLEAADVVLGDRAVPALAAGAKDGGTMDVTIPAGTTPGNYYLIARADGAKVIGETSELNNTQLVPIRIGCDLTITLLKGPLAASPGSVVTLLQTIKNAGPGAAPASTTRYYLSLDAIPGVGDVELTTNAEPGLPGYGVANATVDVPIPKGTSIGRYQILAVADADRLVPELDERNNVRKKAIRVTLLLK